MFDRLHTYLTKDKSTLDGIKCTTRRYTIFYLVMYFLAVNVGLRVLHMLKLGHHVANSPLRVKFMVISGVSLVLVIGRYLMSLDAIHQKITKNINTLIGHIKSLNPNAPGEKLTVPDIGCNDELHDIVDAINTKSDQIQSHIDYLKQLIGYVQHEFNTPLSIMQLELERMAKDLPEQKEKIGSIQSEVTHLSEIVRSITALLGGDDRLLTQSNIDISAMIDTLSLEIQVLYPHSHVSITDHRDVELELVSYKPFVTSICRNILENAVKHGSDNVDVEIYSHKIHVIDHGTGIDPSIQNHVRLPFRRKPSGKNTSQGMGLGLSLVKELSQQLGRHIHMSNTGSGTQVVIDRSQNTHIGQ